MTAPIDHAAIKLARAHLSNLAPTSPKRNIVPVPPLMLSPSSDPQWSVHHDRTTFMDPVAAARHRQLHPGRKWEERRLGIRARQAPGPSVHITRK